MAVVEDSAHVMFPETPEEEIKEEQGKVEEREEDVTLLQAEEGRCLDSHLGGAPWRSSGGLEEIIAAARIPLQRRAGELRGGVHHRHRHRPHEWGDPGHGVGAGGAVAEEIVIPIVCEMAELATARAERTATLEAVCTCDSCQKMFTSRHGLTNHKRKVHENPGTCNICNKSFSSAVKVTSHKKFMHSGGKAFLCTNCGHQSRDPSNLMIHSKVVKVVKKRVYPCAVCKKMYKYKRSLACHMEQKHEWLSLPPVEVPGGEKEMEDMEQEDDGLLQVVKVPDGSDGGNTGDRGDKVKPQVEKVPNGAPLRWRCSAVRFAPKLFG
jgi:hypothetical protein